MPFYEYQCKSCGHEFEALQKMSDPALTECPSCKQSELHKKVSAPAFHLKGGGWYVTDFKDKKEGKTDKPAAENKNESTKTSNETKTAAKPDKKES